MMRWFFECYYNDAQDRHKPPGVPVQVLTEPGKLIPALAELAGPLGLR
ncbi:hypothetical protein [Mycolicibacterium goodii]